MKEQTLDKAVSCVTAGRWALAVSGGADSVALLRLVCGRPGVESVVVHLNHQARGAESDADEEFVRQLAASLKLPCEIARRDQIEPSMSDLPNNRSARFRALRLRWFESVVRTKNLNGVILAHHADDQAETVLLRLLRGSGYRGLAGMSPRARIGGLLILRPLLEVRRESLRAYLRSIGQDWREDSSNASPKYARNRVRRTLDHRDELLHDLRELGIACSALREWAREASPDLQREFPVGRLACLPSLLAEESARRWLRAAGAPVSEISPRACADLIEMAADAASAQRRDFPGGISVRRRQGKIAVIS